MRLYVPNRVNRKWLLDATIQISNAIEASKSDDYDFLCKELGKLEYFYRIYCIHYGRTGSKRDKEYYSVLDKVVPNRTPPVGIGFYGYKVLKVVFDNYMTVVGIATLWIPEDAKRSSAFGLKCRCDKVVVKDIELDCDGNGNIRHVPCGLSPMRVWDPIWYSVGKTITVPDFDENRFNECSEGIHFL